MKSNNENQNKPKFIGYIPERINSIHVVIKDAGFPDKPHIPCQLKSVADAEVFFTQLEAFCKSKSFEVSNWGTPKDMIAHIVKATNINIDAEQFKAYCSRQRTEFTQLYINTRPSSEMRTAYEDLLVCFDQMMDRIK